MPPGFRSFIVAEADLADAGRELEYEIFVGEGFFPASADGRISDYADYEARSVFHVITSATDQVVGVVRSVLGTYETLPVGHYVPIRWGSFPTGPVCEYASLAIRPEARTHGLAEELYRSVFALAWRSGLSGLVALVDPWMQDLLNDYYGCAFEQIGPECDYFPGFVVRPIGVSLATLEKVMPVKAPEFWNWLVEGIEQEDVVIDLRSSASRRDPMVDLRMSPHKPIDIAEGRARSDEAETARD